MYQKGKSIKFTWIMSEHTRAGDGGSLGHARSQSLPGIVGAVLGGQSGWENWG